MRKSIRSVILLCLLSFTVGASELYKWVDENGVIHFTDTPPPDQQSIEVEVQEFYPEDNADQGEDVYSEVIEQQRTRREARERQQEKEASERKAEQELEAKSEKNCAQAIHYLNSLKKQCPVFYDGAGILRAQCPGYYYAYEGDRSYIDDDEREKLIKYYTRLVSECSKSSH